MSEPAHFTEDAKQAAIDQWTADPCGPEATLETGTRAYFEVMLAGRSEYGPWMDESLGYAGTRGLDVLDVGCGQGIDVARYAMAGARATGVDLTPRHVELTCAHLSAMGLEAAAVVGDAELLPFPDASFDRVSSNGVLHHTPDMLAALREIHRVLRPGGEACIIVYNRTSLHYWVHQVVVQGLLKGHLFRERGMNGVLSRTVERSSIDARPLVRVYSPRALRRLMCEAGLRSVSTSVRHLRAVGRLAAPLDRRARAAGAGAALDRLGHVAGWYVIGRGTRAEPASGGLTRACRRRGPTI